MPLTTGASATLVFGQGGSFTLECVRLRHQWQVETVHPPPTTCAIQPRSRLDGLGNLYVADPATPGCWSTTLRSMRTAAKAAPAIPPLIRSLAKTGASRRERAAPLRSLPTACAFHQESPSTASGNVYVADGNSERVLEYNTPLTSGTNAENVFGTCGSFTVCPHARGSAPTASTIRRESRWTLPATSTWRITRTIGCSNTINRCRFPRRPRPHQPRLR